MLNTICGSSCRLVFATGFLVTSIGCSFAPKASDVQQNTPAPLPVDRLLSERPEQNGTIYQNHLNHLLFRDNTAKQRGDLITVILDEKTVAAKSASTRSSKDTSIDFPSPTILGTQLTRNGKPLNTSVESGNVFSGAGDSNQSNSLNGSITVTVVDTTPTGNLIIKGEKHLTLNSGREIISINGTVRPGDVSPDNTVLSSLIANAQIVYNGQGLIADSNNAGWLTRVVNSKYWPF